MKIIGNHFCVLISLLFLGCKSPKFPFDQNLSSKTTINQTPTTELLAIAEINEPDWYSQLKTVGQKFSTTSLSKYYAPHAVFFEGWKSSPKDQIEKYEWDFGDGSPIAYGFNAAHVYESPGKYTARLIITSFEGDKNQSTLEIEVLERKGTIYYVDSLIGDDLNSGLDPSVPWKTATMAFSGMNNTRYKEGDQILFKRNLTYEMEAGIVKPSHYKTGFGYLFGAYGNGDLPKIIHTGNSTLPMIDIKGLHLGFVTFQDLEFDALSPSGQLSTFYSNVAPSIQILFQRVKIRNFYQAIGAHAGTGNNSISNYFIFNSEITNSTLSDDIFLTSNLHIYFQGYRLGLVGNKFDYSNNHLAYISWVNNFVAYKNEFSRASSGRTFLRLAAASGDFNVPSEHMYIGFNQFNGWIDPFNDNSSTHAGNGIRFNLSQLHMGPNTTIPQSMKDALVEFNNFKDAENFITISCYDDVIIRHNNFITSDTYPASARIKIGASFEKRPVKNILITKNTFTNTHTRNGGTPFILRVESYNGPEFRDSDFHENINFINNEVFLGEARHRLISIAGNNLNQQSQLNSDNNIIHSQLIDPKIFQINGTYNTLGTVFNLQQWQNYSYQDLNSYLNQ